MYTLKVVDTTRQTSLEDGKEYIDVSIEISKDGNVVDTRRLAFAFDEVLADGGLQKDLDNYLETYVSDLEATQANKEKEEQDAKIAARLEELKGLEVSREAKIKGEDGVVVAPVEEENDKTEA